MLGIVRGEIVLGVVGGGVVLWGWAAPASRRPSALCRPDMCRDVPRRYLQSDGDLDEMQVI